MTRLQTRDWLRACGWCSHPGPYPGEPAERSAVTVLTFLNPEPCISLCPGQGRLLTSPVSTTAYPVWTDFQRSRASSGPLRQRVAPGPPRGAVGEKALIHLWGTVGTEEQQPDPFPAPSQGIPSQRETAPSTKAAKTWESSRGRDSGPREATSQFHPWVRGASTSADSKRKGESREQQAERPARWGRWVVLQQQGVAPGRGGGASGISVGRGRGQAFPPRPPRCASVCPPVATELAVPVHCPRAVSVCTQVLSAGWNL